MVVVSLINGGLEAYLWYLTFFKPVVCGAQLCRQAEPRATEVTNVTMAIIFGWLLEAAGRLFLSSFIAIRWAYLAMRIVVCLYLQHPKLLGANKVYETAFAGIVDRYGPMVDSLLLQHMERMSEMGFIHYATSVGLTLVRALSSVVEMGQALIDTSTSTDVAPAPLPRRLSQERDRQGEEPEQQTAPPRRAPVGHTESSNSTSVTEPRRRHVPPSLPPRSPPPAPRLGDSSEDSDDSTAPFASVRPGRTAASPAARRPARAFSRQASQGSSEL